jgi:hypothetical protein
VDCGFSGGGDTLVCIAVATSRGDLIASFSDVLVVVGLRWYIPL